jgi:hypothetical protein
MLARSMKDPRKEKPPEDDLAPAMIGCWFLAVLMFGSCIWTFLHRSAFAIKKDTVPISAYNGVVDLALFLAIQMPLVLGLAFFAFGCLIWKAYRKLRRVRNSVREC